MLATQKRYKECLEYCEKLKLQTLNEEEYIFAKPFGFRISKKAAITWPTPDHYQPSSDTLIINKTGGVEMATCEHLSASGDYFYVENRLFTCVFGLCYWKVIFALIPGAFTHPFQTKPHDLYEEEFMAERREYFTAAQKTISNISDFKQAVHRQINEKSGITTPFIAWSNIDKKVIDLTLNRIPMPHGESIFDRMWQHLQVNRSGFPDLMFFPATGGYELIEAKGPGDKLQKNQLRWMHYFHRHHIPHRVINVEWQA